MTARPTTWAWSGRMRLEVAFVGLAMAVTIVVCVVLFSEQGPVAEDGGDDPGPVVLILTVFYLVQVLVAAAMLIGIVEVVLWATRVFRRRDSSDH